MDLHQKRFNKFILFLTIAIFPWHYAISQEEQLNISELPHILYSPNDTTIMWIEGNERLAVSSKDSVAYQVAIMELSSKFGIPLAEALSFNFNTHKFKTRLNSIDKFTAVSDIHGQYDLFVELLKANNVIDRENNWSYGNGVLLINGDIFDRGDKVSESLWLVFKLYVQAREHGGEVIYQSGNHELMIFDKDLRYINDKYKVASELFEKSYDELYISPNSFFGKWLKELPIMTLINDILFTHAGVSEELVNRKLSIETINQLFIDSIYTREKEEYRKSEQLNFLARTNGPLWYRGYFKDESLNTADVKNWVNQYQANHLVVGHTSQKEIRTLFNNTIIAIDSSIKGGKHGEILVYENGKLYASDRAGNRRLLFETIKPSFEYPR